jgi:hypothetical protein
MGPGIPEHCDSRFDRRLLGNIGWFVCRSESGITSLGHVYSVQTITAIAIPRRPKTGGSGMPNTISGGGGGAESVLLGASSNTLISERAAGAAGGGMLVGAAATAAAAGVLAGVATTGGGVLVGAVTAAAAAAGVLAGVATVLTATGVAEAVLGLCDGTGLVAVAVGSVLALCVGGSETRSCSGTRCAVTEAVADWSFASTSVCSASVGAAVETNTVGVNSSSVFGRFGVLGLEGTRGDASLNEAGESNAVTDE